MVPVELVLAGIGPPDIEDPVVEIELEVEEPVEKYAEVVLAGIGPPEEDADETDADEIDADDDDDGDENEDDDHP